MAIERLHIDFDVQLCGGGRRYADFFLRPSGFPATSRPLDGYGTAAQTWKMTVNLPEKAKRQSGGVKRDPCASQLQCVVS